MTGLYWFLASLIYILMILAIVRVTRWGSENPIVNQFTKEN